MFNISTCITWYVTAEGREQICCYGDEERGLLDEERWSTYNIMSKWIWEETKNTRIPRSCQA